MASTAQRREWRKTGFWLLGIGAFVPLLSKLVKFALVKLKIEECSAVFDKKALLDFDWGQFTYAEALGCAVAIAGLLAILPISDWFSGIAEMRRAKFGLNKKK